MKKTLVALFIVAAIVIPQTAVYGQGHRTKSQTIQTESGSRTVVVRYFAESEEWAEDVFETIRKGFPILEKRIGVPCPTTYDIVVEETTSLKAGVGGVNKGPLGMVVPTGTSTNVIIHELCHYWFGYLPDLHWSNWILEGFPEAYTVSVLQDLNHPDGYNHYYNRLNGYEWAKSEFGGDKPLNEVGYSPDFEDPRVGMLYSKATVFCSWLLLYFGEESMHEINGQIIHMNPLRTEDYQAIAEEVTGEELDWLFSGWVYPGDYYYQGKKVSFEWFAGDGDKDGISTLAEIKTGSNPLIADTDNDGLPDGYEPLVKTKLDNPDTDNDGLPDSEEVPIIIDGKNTEWKNPIIRDDKDSESSKGPDIKAVYYAADDRFMYFMIELYNDYDTAHRIGILVDVDDDRYANYIFYILYGHLILGTWTEDDYTVTADPQTLKDTFAVADKVIEIRIPKGMRQIKFPNMIKVWASEYSFADRETTDKSSSVSILLKKTLESTNPLDPDSDDDGLLDGEDESPLSAEPETPETPEETEAPETPAPELAEAEPAETEPEAEEVEAPETPEEEQDAGPMNICTVGTVFLGFFIFFLVRKHP
jgi:hypothetical protein